MKVLGLRGRTIESHRSSYRVGIGGYEAGMRGGRGGVH